MTVHRWSGIGDGRYCAGKIEKLLLYDESHRASLVRIKCTELLIIDEIYMLSEHMFNLLEHVCSIRDRDKVFGGVQLVVVGDFKQLPPARNLQYGDPGNFCFHSKYFPRHYIFLEEVMRQSDHYLIDCIRHFSNGVINDQLVQYVQSLSRPLNVCHTDDTEAVTRKLFANNTLVDIYNRDKILNCLDSCFHFMPSIQGNLKNYISLLFQRSCG